MKDGKLDLAIGFFPALGNSFEKLELFVETYLVVCRKDHWLVGESLRLKDYCEADHLLVSIGGDFRGIVDETLKDRGLARNVVVAVPQFFAALGTVAATDLIATMPKRFAEQYAGYFGLTTMEPPLQIRPFTVSAVWHKRSVSDLALTWFTKKLKAVVN